MPNSCGCTKAHRCGASATFSSSPSVDISGLVRQCISDATDVIVVTLSGCRPTPPGCSLAIAAARGREDGLGINSASPVNSALRTDGGNDDVGRDLGNATVVRCRNRGGNCITTGAIDGPVAFTGGNSARLRGLTAPTSFNVDR